MLIFNNLTIIYDALEKKCEVINNGDNSLKNDKIFNMDFFKRDLLTSKILKRINNKLFASKVLFYTWNNYNDADKKALRDILSDFNINDVSFKSVKSLFNQKLINIIISNDGIHYYGNKYKYYDFDVFGKNKVKLINNKVKDTKIVVIGNGAKAVSDANNSYIYENNDTYFTDLLKI